MALGEIPSVHLHNGVSVPVLSIGTYQARDLDTVIKTSFDVGITAVDTAEHYGNEAAVGDALANLNYPRDQWFLSTKIWNTDHGYRRTLEAFEESVSRLHTDPDMLLIHWPCPMKGLYQETWQALQHLYRQGRVRSIGVSNFKASHLEELRKIGGVQPMVNQIEMHPFYIDEELHDYCTRWNIVVEAWSPLLRGKTVISNALIKEMAAAYHRSSAQLAIRYLTQYGVRVVVKASNPEHIKENADVFDFEISREDVERLKTLNRRERYFQDPDQYYL